MNLLDLCIIAAAVAATVAGARLGFITRAAGWAGMVAGLLAASRVAPRLAERVARGEPGRALVVVALTLSGGALLGQFLGQLAGQRVRLRAHAGWQERADRTVGGASGLAAVLATVWLLTPTLTEVPEWPSREAQGSLIVAAIDEVTPDPPNPLQTLSGLVSEDQWDRLLDQMKGPSAIAPPPERVPVDSGADAAARAAVVRVSHTGCGGELDGTGFAAVRPGLIVTNAHVVAGRRRLRVHGDWGSAAARVVYFDPDEDLAVLSVDEATAAELPPLALAETKLGQQGIVYGHPGGGELEARTFQITIRRRLPTGDIYDEAAPVSRDVSLVAAYLQRGDSGSPLVNFEEGRPTVVGVAWAVARDSTGVALASTTTAVQLALDRAEAALAADPELDTDTGRCLADS